MAGAIISTTSKPCASLGSYHALIAERRRQRPPQEARRQPQAGRVDIVEGIARSGKNLENRNPRILISDGATAAANRPSVALAALPPAHSRSTQWAKHSQRCPGCPNARTDLSAAVIPLTEPYRIWIAPASSQPPTSSLGMPTAKSTHLLLSKSPAASALPKRSPSSALSTMPKRF